MNHIIEENIKYEQIINIDKKTIIKFGGISTFNCMKINMIDYFDFWYKFFKFMFGIYTPIMKHDESEYLKRRIFTLEKQVKKLERQIYF